MVCRRIVLFAALITVSAPFFAPQALYAQDAADSLAENAENTENTENTENAENAENTENIELTEEEIAALEEKAEALRIMDLEIKTSTLAELAEWCRELGLSEGGSREDMANRLRDHLGVPRPNGGATPNQKIVTIESAKTTEYFTIAR
jgi:TolA-binding protein